MVFKAPSNTADFIAELERRKGRSYSDTEKKYVRSIIESAYQKNYFIDDVRKAFEKDKDFKFDGKTFTNPDAETLEDFEKMQFYIFWILLEKLGNRSFVPDGARRDTFNAPQKPYNFKKHFEDKYGVNVDTKVVKIFGSISSSSFLHQALDKEATKINKNDSEEEIRNKLGVQI